MRGQSVSYEEAIEAAASLYEGGDGIPPVRKQSDEYSLGEYEYMRGMCEAIARMFPEQDVATSERMEDIWQDVEEALEIMESRWREIRRREEDTRSTMNRVILVGVSGREPDIGRDERGTVLHMSVATKKEDGNPEWHRVTVHPPLSDDILGRVGKGVRLYISGELLYGTFEQDGVTVPTAEIIAKDIVIL